MQVGVIGTGKMGQNHVRVYRSHELNCSVSVFDSDAGLASDVAKKHGAAAVDSIERLLNEVEAIDICTPTSTHEALAVRFLEAGIPTLIEKPLAPTFDACMNIRKAAGRTTAMVGHVERFNPAVDALRNALYGQEVRVFVAQRLGTYPQRITDCGITKDLAIHDIDLARYVLGGLPYTVFARTKNRNGGQHEDHVSMQLDFGEAVATIIADWTPEAKRRELSVASDKGIYQVDLERQSVVKKLPVGRFENWQSWEELVTKTAAQQDIPVKRGEPLLAELKEFHHCVHNKKTPAVTLDDGTYAVAIAGGALASAEKRAEVGIKYASSFY